MLAFVRKQDGQLLAILSVSLLMNLILGVAYVRLARQLVLPSMSAETVSAPKTIPSLILERRDGTAVRLDFASQERPTVLYFLSSTCEWCKRNTNGVRALHAARRESYRFVGISVGPSPFSDFDDLGFEILALPKDRESILDSYGVRGTPSTLVVSGKGEVLQTWPGAYMGRTAEQMQAYFRVRLPEVEVP